MFLQRPDEGPLNQKKKKKIDAAVSPRSVFIELCRRSVFKMTLKVMTVEGIDLKLRCWWVFCKPYGQYRSLSDENRARKRKNSL
jgi:hypothetical protein